MSNQCRICFESDNHQDLISPCNCSGTSKYVHRDCLNRWRILSNNPDSITHCNECKFEYIMQINEITHNCLRRISSLLENHINISLFLNVVYFIAISLIISYISITIFKYFNYHIVYLVSVLVYMISIIAMILFNICCNRNIQIRLYLDYYRHLNFKNIVLIILSLFLLFTINDIIALLFSTLILRFFVIKHYNIVRRLDMTSTNEILDLDTLGS